MGLHDYLVRNQVSVTVKIVATKSFRRLPHKSKYKPLDHRNGLKSVRKTQRKLMLSGYLFPDRQSR